MSTKRFKHLPLALALIMMLTLIGCGTQIPSGHRAIFYYKFSGGTEMGTVYHEGFTWHLPWNSMYVYKIQLQENKEAITVLSSDGATIKLEVSLMYRPIAAHLDSLQVTIGRNYYMVAVSPMIRGIARAVAGNYTPEEIYSTKRDEMAAEIVRQLQEAMATKFIQIENVVVRDVKIPPKISEAIDLKLTAEQESERMKYTIAKERREAERKRIEAQGIADFQEIVSAGITTSLLKWKGIEATLKIAESPNSKIVIIGNDAGSLPVILSSD